MHSVAPDDIVDTFDDVDQGGRPPLLVLDPLERFLDERGLGSGALLAEPIGEGHSNVTFAILRKGFDGVLRRPPRPPIPPSAHDVVREARILQALRGVARVPRVLTVCEDDSVIGAPFYVMERLEGDVLTSSVPPQLDSFGLRRAIGVELVDALAEVHAVEWESAGLGAFGRPSGYLERQLRRFTGLWELNATREVPAIERLASWLGANLPESGPATCVHGDYRLGNVMFAFEAPPRLSAIFDWEMATIGDPLADVGYLTALWAEPDDPPLAIFELSLVTRSPGFASRDELVELYESRTGRRMTDVRWYQALALWKATIFMEGNYRRSLEGGTDDPFVAGFGQAVEEMAAYAWDRVR